MAGRGRGGRAPQLSLNAEQFGFGKGEEKIALPPVLQPPLKYPPMEYKAPPFQLTVELSYLLQLKRDFGEALRESPNNVQPIAVKKDIERYSDRYQDMMVDKSTYEQRYDWNKFPKELKPGGRKRKAKKSQVEPKIKKEVDVEKKLQELEKKEVTQKSDDEDEKGDQDGEEKDGDEAVEDEEAEVDEEMDDGTDYVNNYFDNGEGYEDEDDNLDDGPIY
ncbi:DNA-directed RNA polymerase III subunit RPC7-like [Fopius arisanus]|uniref:DNA-directed RNA polymerase III subunit RPC7-like n=1 Tax=Fopius arisanus TaxID=64838 RepID=A0A9R1TTV5_9HYME|nr:PREDICTED: DNA-directed RNA polymerase III subunit RPC7-like [Fopius arisanus]XP_011298287.1 PREDICTED: DNA-directed RNA polymerase III subunit RPC7-like [Fopius arisanus]XP_011298288.1 PREDICTED: DNA-directed RNA polymerase III subunit RPC7-like [Fopius arisanus]